jgi:hypothetical protein
LVYFKEKQIMHDFDEDIGTFYEDLITHRELDDSSYWQEKFAEDIFRKKTRAHIAENLLIERNVHWVCDQESRYDIEGQFINLSWMEGVEYSFGYEWEFKQNRLHALLVIWFIEGDKLIMRVLGERHMVEEFFNKLHLFGSACFACEISSDGKINKLR